MAGILHTATRTKPVIDPGHGDAFTDHMVGIEWTPEQQWTRPVLLPLADLAMHPGTVGLHYGQVAFEGLKAHRQPDGSMAVFRPWDNARRFRRSVARLAMPELPDELFVTAIDDLVRHDEGWLSDDPSHSLYLRPLMYGDERTLMLRPSRTYRFLLMAFVTGGFFGDDVDSVSVWVAHEHPRAFPGGTGDVKIAGNYAPTFNAQQQAQAAGCQQVIWLDATEREWVEEMGGMNLFFVRGHGSRAEVVTPRLSGTLLPGVTRDTLLTLAARLGLTPREERIGLRQWRRQCLDGDITEVFACGTAAVVTPVGRVRDRDGDWTIGDGTPGPVTRALRTALVDLHHGIAPDPDGWMHHIH
ncbi:MULTISPECIES: branched-chain amino acid aminotransferase [unclassified Nonomuraea]|uniref:branched-chain amino acid aminotransferase n=1 Tax=unclassified Nonomuraea TaxID=2593643 RepID=UPI0033C89DAC